MVQADPVHGQLLCVLQVVELCLGRRLALEGGAVDLHDLLEQVVGLRRREVELSQVVDADAVLHRVVVAQLALHQVGAKEGVSHEGAGELPRFDVVLDLEKNKLLAIVPAKQQ